MILATSVVRFTVEPVLVESPDRSCEVDSEDLWCSRLTLQRRRKGWSILVGKITESGRLWLQITWLSCCVLHGQSGLGICSCIKCYQHVIYRLYRHPPCSVDNSARSVTGYIQRSPPGPSRPITIEKKGGFTHS